MLGEGIDAEWPIDPVFDKLEIWGGIALVAKLKPADGAPRARRSKRLGPSSWTGPVTWEAQ